ITYIDHEDHKEFNVMNDPIKEWLDEYEEEGKDLHIVAVSSAYNDYKTFCEHNGIKYPVSKKRLTQELKNHGYESERVRVKGQQFRAYTLHHATDIEL